MSYLLKKKKKKSVLLTRAELKSVETTLAILSRNEFKYRELGAYKISGGGGGRALGWEADMTPQRVLQESCSPGKSQEAPPVPLASGARCHCRSPAVRKLPPVLPLPTTKTVIGTGTPRRDFHHLQGRAYAWSWRSGQSA